MELWILRHGEAGQEPADELGPTLSDWGVAQIRRVAEALQDLPRQPKALYSSPLRRAMQTADIFNEAWGLQREVVDWLKPGVEPSQILQRLSQTHDEVLAVVGHLPSLGWLFSLLVWGLPPKEVVLPKGSVSCLQLKSWEPAEAKLQWVYHPELGMKQNH